MGYNRIEDSLSFEEIVVKGVHVNINSCGCSREEARPLPEEEQAQKQQRLVTKSKLLTHFTLMASLTQERKLHLLYLN